MDDETRREVIKAVIGLFGTAATIGLIVLGAQAERKASSADWHPLRDLRRLLDRANRVMEPPAATVPEPTHEDVRMMHDEARRITRGEP